jgi:hypothetical protein
MGLKEQKLKDFERRDKRHTEECQKVFEKDCEVKYITKIISMTRLNA